jgi:hypothetical protein
MTASRLLEAIKQLARKPKNRSHTCIFPVRFADRENANSMKLQIVMHGSWLHDQAGTASWSTVNNKGVLWGRVAKHVPVLVLNQLTEASINARIKALIKGLPRADFSGEPSIKWCMGSLPA